MLKVFSFLTAGLALTLSAAIFGFFYAWVCSTMWGLDAADPRVAIEAMNAMNGSVRNWVFAPAFFGPGPAFLLAALLAGLVRARCAAALFVLAGFVYVLFAQILTMSVNVPMNEALGQTLTPTSAIEAERLWSDYSTRWQRFNTIRTVTSLLAFWIGIMGMVSLCRHHYSAVRIARPHGRSGVPALESAI